MATYAATAKQRSYYKSLTGEWPPFGASKSTVSRLIDKALKGEIKKRVPVIEVKGFAIDAWYNDMHGEKKFGWSVDYRCEVSNFETFDEALAACKRRYPEAEIIESRNTVHRTCVD